jgi:hypothetical protein
MRDGEMHATAMIGTGLLAAALVVPIVWLSSGKSVAAPAIDKMTMIEASLAVKATKVKQPQKETHEPPPVVKPEGVSHDADKKPPLEDKKKDEPPKKTDDKPPPDITKFHHASDDDTPAGPQKTPVGQFDGSQFGNAPVSKGDPYLQRLVADMHYNPPEIAKGNGVPVGCIHIQPDGKIVDTKFQTKTDDDLQTAAEAALKELVKARTDKPEEVPTNLLGLTTEWLCFHFNVSIK